MEMDEIDERKSNQIVKLIEKHEHAFTDMQNYYGDIVQSNLELIENLKQQMQALAEQLEKSEQRLKKVRALCIVHCELWHFVIEIASGKESETVQDRGYNEGNI